ncbi:hypothetical protein, partial [Klebsiella pneumoniae]|uniref:hypothetical protein n=1 Tax=Klebsiella pneumoniae TaxID=573 RepID=UPI0035321F70
MTFFSKDPFQSQHTDTDEEHEEMEVLPEHVESFRKDKHLQKIMDILLNEEKEKYFLQLAQEGARLPPHFNVKDLITPVEETETSELKKKKKIVQDQMAQIMKDKDKPTTT